MRSNDQLLCILSSFICHSVMSPKHCPLILFCQTEGMFMLRNEETVEYSQTSKSKNQEHKNKDYLKYSIYSLLQ